ncbi:hypothetical protein PF003_g36225 [Phytophthora fragariae]|nr:hypothetical protein PF003_g36225 [Phytophthora fragariae]
MASGVQDPKPAASKPKAAKTLEIKAEEDVHAPATGAQDNQQTHNRYGGHPGGSTRPCGRTSVRAARRVQEGTTAQEAGLELSEGQAPARLAKRKSGGVENVRGLTQRKSGDDHGTAEVPGKDDEVESPAEAKHVEEETMRTPDEGDTNSSAARTAAESAAESILAEMEEAEGSGQPASTTAATAGSSAEADRAHAAEEDHASKPRKGLTRQQLLVSGGRTVAARRRQRRTEQELATLQGILMPELRERCAERAKVLRLIVKTLITEVNTAVDAGGKKQRQRSVQAVVAEARQVELAAMNQGRSDVKDAPQTVARKKTRRDESRATATAVAEKNKTEDEWLECMRQRE